MATIAYYECGVIGDGLSTETAFRPSLAPTVDAEGCAWVQISSDGTTAVIQVADARADGSTADGLHAACAQQATYLGETLPQ